MEKNKQILEALETPLTRQDRAVLLTIEDIILLLIYSVGKPIINRTLLFKEIFLTYKEVLPEFQKLHKVRVAKPHFFPYKYGPYSQNVAEALTNLLSQQLIKVKGRAKGRKESFELTESGEKYVRGLIRRYEVLQSLKAILKEKRIEWDELGRDGILRYVYQKYPEYTKLSDVKEKYSGVKWGNIFRE